GPGVPVRATVSDFGPQLLAKTLGANETQEQSLQLVFHYADTKGLPLLDLADLRALLTFLDSDAGKGELEGIGGLSTQTVGVLLRALVGLETGGGTEFFGEPQLDVADLLRTTEDGRGVISCLELAAVQDKPVLWSTALLWLVAELFETLPEAGDLPKPKVVVFLDEAHLLFDDATEAFRDALERTVRLIRSKGVGVFFVTQAPTDLPAEVLGQLGNRVQHALRAFTPDDAQALRQTVSTFPTSELYDLEELLPSLGIGEAAITLLSENGVPTPVVHSRLPPPRSRMAPADDLDALAKASPLMAKYGARVDAESARERLAARMERAAEPEPEPEHVPLPRDMRRARLPALERGPGAEAGPVQDAEEAPVTPTPPFTQEHEELRESVRRFVLTELRPHATEWEDAHWFPDEVFAKFAEHGFLGLKYPEEHGGEGGDYLHEAVLAEELARCGSGGLAAGVGAHVNIATPPVWKFGTDDQKARYLAPSIRGEKIAALAITEPDAGSDVAGIKTHAKKVDGGWVVNGSKMFITNGVRAHYWVTAVKTAHEGGHHGLSFMIVDRQEGVSATAIEKLGWHASDTGLVTYDDAFVPEENLLGRENEGFYLIMANFQWERLLMALGAVGGMRVAYEKTVRFAQERQAFGRPLTKHQAIRHKLTDVATTIHTGQCITYDALRRFVEGQDAVKEVTMAKLATQRAAFDVMDTCLQIHGGAGYMKEYEIERMARDARLGPIGGGTDEIMHEILGKVLGL
ncbi:MAG: DUF853 family protein, partial [Solirubrobacterales bacterium]|nr:DUF853 family protein [Solirubrobacterales bacterium]